MISNEILLKAKERLVDGFDPNRIILFDSQARGKAKKREIPLKNMTSLTKRAIVTLTVFERSWNHDS